MPIRRRGPFLLIFLATISLLWIGGRSMQAQGVPVADLRDGQAIFQAGCAGCHGPRGQGMTDTTVGFAKPDTFPDFSQCDQTTPEVDIDWKSIIRNGGRARGFSPIMPAFGDLLTPSQIDAVVGYIRSFCQDRSWPRGELNLPRPLMTEKAFPEGETVVTTSIGTRRSPDVANELVYERRIGARNQIEVSVPFSFVHDTGGTVNGGVGDAGFGLKRVLFASHERGSILSVQGEAVLPTGDRDRGFGAGVTVFEAFGAFGQMLPFDSFVQVQAGTEQPVDTAIAPRAVFGRVAFGKSLRQDGGFGRLWTPMLEVVSDRELESAAATDVDLVPQFQVSLSRRQHVRANVGLAIPVANTAGRSKQVVFYLLWDWLDGGFLEGWR
jgi:mono/diheme cytochrome c family protein